MRLRARLATLLAAAGLTATVVLPGLATAAGTHPIGYWPTYHQNAARTGVDTTSPTLGKTAVAWRKRLDGAVYASPLIVGGDDIVATENDTVYALRSGRVVWSRHLGAPVDQSTLPCGNIDPLGITSTPVYDQSSGTLYVAAELAGPLRHTLYALDVVTGAVRWSRSLDLPGLDRRVEQQRGALALAAGTVYVPFGALWGDCSDYHGALVAYRTSGAGPLSYITSPYGSGIWAPPGPTVTADDRLLIATANSKVPSGARYDYSVSVVALTSSLRRLDWFAPATWHSESNADVGLGSSGPTLLPDGQVFIGGKSPEAFLLDGADLGHVGGQLATLTGCAVYGGTATYRGVVFAPCSDGLEAIKVAGNRMTVLWKAAPTITGSPIYGGGAVWTLDQQAGVVYGLSRTTGKVLRTVTVGQTSRFATMAMLHGYLHVPTLRGIVVVRTG